MHEKGCDVSKRIGQTDYLRFRSLDYEGNPIIYGGRFKQLPMGYRTEKNPD